MTEFETFTPDAWADNSTVGAVRIGAAEEGLNSAFSGVLQAYRDEGYRAGYARASSDLLADFIFLAEQFIHDQPAEQRASLRPALRAFEQYLASAIGQRRGADTFVDGGLGI